MMVTPGERISPAESTSSTASALTNIMQAKPTWNRIFLIFLTATALSLAPVPVADAADHDGGVSTGCHGAVNVILFSDQCTDDGCSGVNILVDSQGSCTGADGSPGQDGGNGCTGPTVVVGGALNCRGGDGGAGKHGGDGGAGCTDAVVNILSHFNCTGGNGGDGTS